MHDNEQDAAEDGSLWHSGGHRKYTDFTQSKLEVVSNEAEGKNITDEQVAEMVSEKAELMEYLISIGAVPANDRGE
jgi:hypothetical protein